MFVRCLGGRCEMRSERNQEVVTVGLFIVCAIGMAAGQSRYIDSSLHYTQRSTEQG